MAAVSVAHPDGRPYPWLSAAGPTEGASSEGGENERFLLYQPFAGMCNQFSCLECAVALARALGRTLVLPRWRPQYGCAWAGGTEEYFDPAALSRLVRCVTLDEFAARRRARRGGGGEGGGTAGGEERGGDGVALFRLSLAYNPTWSDRGFALYPLLRTLLEQLDYFREMDANGELRLGCGRPRDGAAGGAAGDEHDVGADVSVEHEERHTLVRPLRGVRELSALFGDVSQPVLALDHAFNILALPAVLDAGERQLLLNALRPCARLKAKLNAYAAAHISRPSLAVHVRRTDHWRLAQLMGDGRYWPRASDFGAQIASQKSSRRLASWVLATDCTDAHELGLLREAAPGRVDTLSLFEGEDDVACAVLDMWLCAGSDLFMGTRGSMYTEYIQRFRVADGRVVDHVFFEAGAAAASPASAPAAAADADAAPAAQSPPSLADVLDARASRSEAANAAARSTLQAAAGGGAARGDAMLGLMSMKLPPSLRAKVLAFHPRAEDMPAAVCRTPHELFTEFIHDELPRLRKLGPLLVAPPGSTCHVALLIEPRAHECLEHVIRNAMLMLNGRDSVEWQLQVFHGSTNLEYLRSCFDESELRHVQFVSLEVDNLSPLAHNELMCTHWLWSRAAAERVLIFQTDSLICSDGGLEPFEQWDYIGAPWRTDDLWCVGKPWLTSVGANGGFSYRSARKTLECIDSVGYVRGQCEDVYYAEAMPRVGGRIATREAGLAFSTESVYAEGSFGFHAAYKWLTAEEMGAILDGIRAVYARIESDSGELSGEPLTASAAALSVE